MIIGRPIAKVLDFFTGIAAFITVGYLIFYYINVAILQNGLGFGLITEENLINYTKTRDTFLFLVVGLASLSFALKRNVILFIICAIIIVAAGVLMFYTGVFA